MYKINFLRDLLEACNDDKSGQEFMKEKKVFCLPAQAWKDVSRDTLTHAWHKLMLTSIFLEEDKDNNFAGFNISKETLHQQEINEYAEATLQSDILTKFDINDCFHINNDVPVTGKMSDSKIIDKVLHPNQNVTSEKMTVQTKAQKEKISNSRCIELIQEIIKGMKQKSFLDEFPIMAVYKIKN